MAARQERKPLPTLSSSVCLRVALGLLADVLLRKRTSEPQSSWYGRHSLPEQLSPARRSDSSLGGPHAHGVHATAAHGSRHLAAEAAAHVAEVDRAACRATSKLCGMGSS